MTDGKLIASTCYEGSLEYIERFNLPKNKTLIIGRALEDFTVNDVLFTEDNTPIYIEGFHLYGHEMDFISAGCTCYIICTRNEYKFTYDEILKIKGVDFIKDGIKPNPDRIFPVPNCDTVTYVKPTIKNPNIIVGDFTYFSDVDFESHVTHHYDFYGDRLIIGKFCQIASGVEFVMNGANHQMNAVSTYPFYIMEGWKQSIPPLSELTHKGDTVVGNDVWIGQNVTILSGVHIGDGAIIGLNSVVGSDVPPYTIVAGNPARAIRKRFDDELINLMLEFRWWDKSIEEINKLIPLLSCSNLEKVKSEIKDYLNHEE